MNKSLQKLILTLPISDTVLLTVLLNENILEHWEKNKRLIICTTPKVTLEMAINKTALCNHDSIPSPKQIHEALKYAKNLSIYHSSQDSLPMAANG